MFLSSSAAEDFFCFGDPGPMKKEKSIEGLQTEKFSNSILNKHGLFPRDGIARPFAAAW